MSATNWTLALQERFTADWNAKLSIRDIARRLDITIGMVNRMARKLGLTRRPPIRLGRPRKQPTDNTNARGPSNRDVSTGRGHGGRRAAGQPICKFTGPADGEGHSAGPLRNETSSIIGSGAEAPSNPDLIPATQRKTLLELNPDSCRWPVGDPRDANFFFCGGGAIAGRPYCAYHASVAYTRPGAAP